MIQSTATQVQERLSLFLSEPVPIIGGFMIKKTAAAGLVAGAALGALLMGAPAHASHGGDQQFNQNLQLVPVQSCNLDASVGLVAVTAPVLSPQTTGDCVNGPVGTNIS